MTSSVDRRLLGIYLNDHVTGATAALARVRRMAQTYSSTPVGSICQEIAAEIDGERSWLLDLMHDLGLPVRKYKVAGALVAERLGRLKLNGRLVRRSRLAPLLEAEILRSGISGKYSGWSTLAVIAVDAGISPSQREDLTELREGVARQLERVDSALEWLRPRVFVEQSTDRSTLGAGGAR